MANPYELLAGLALLREKKRRSHQHIDRELHEWSGFQVRIGKLTCLIPCEQVEEVMTPSTVAMARNVPAWVVGVAYFRAQLVTLVSAAALLLGDMRAAGASARVFVLRGKQEWFGLQVSAFDGVRHIWSDTQVVAAPEGFTGAWLQYVPQWLALDGETVAVLDSHRLLRALENGEVRA